MNKETFTSLGMSVNEKKDTKSEAITEKVGPPTIKISNGDAQQAYLNSLIPTAYINAEFDEQKIRLNIAEQSAKTARKFVVKHFSDYIGVLNKILTGVRIGKVPTCSYIIGAPNGFGKASFANTCIKIMFKRGMRCVPYISLLELAELRRETEKELVKGLIVRRDKATDIAENDYLTRRDEVVYRKSPEVITGDFSWSEYMNSDILFCYMASIESKDIESKTLQTILNIRGTKGLPTIVFISTALTPYKQDKQIGELIWDEILTIKEEENTFDKVYHVSCYKKQKQYIDEENDTIE